MQPKLVFITTADEDEVEAFDAHWSSKHQVCGPLPEPPHGFRQCLWREREGAPPLQLALFFIEYLLPVGTQGDDGHLLLSRRERTRSLYFLAPDQEHVDAYCRDVLGMVVQGEAGES